MIWTLLVVVVVFGLIVFVHELGHFLVAKRTGVGVEEFAFGFPPRLAARKIGQTTYAINLIPLGGYVKLIGEDAKSNDEAAFNQASAFARGLIVIAGVVANVILTWILLTVLLLVPASVKQVDAVLVASVIKDSAADTIGITAGDMIRSVDSTVVKTTTELHDVTRAHADQPVSIVIRRNGIDQPKQVSLGHGETPLGVSVTSASLSDVPNPPVWKAPLVAVQIIGRVAVANFGFIWALLISPFHGGGAAVVEQVSGPIGIYGILAQFTALGWPYVLFGAAELSLAVALFNILPIPALDGGRFLFIVLERMFKRRAVSEKIEGIIHSAGFAILIGLFVLVTWHDIVKLLR